ncbi:hypothetical protein [Microbacter margulisiae]|uniref:Uncharacterized protein n=1 Tax=Microbacter margulisiae TaxID=1350067 RepID=A0A7W5H3D2_9PORP|nr:hypothetical protein [Microbacter margulisiae]MBB3188282.1 hypothetical protein [Microbacter margulisiae]
MNLKIKYSILILALLLSSLDSYAVVYQRDHSSSPIIRFLKSLFTGESGKPTAVTIPGGEAGQIYYYNDFQQSSGIVTTHHSIVSNSEESNTSPMWGTVTANSYSSGISGNSNVSSTSTSSNTSSGLSIPLAADETVLGSSGSISNSSSGGGGSSASSSSSLGGYSLFTSNLTQYSLATTNLSSSNPYTHNNQGQHGHYGNGGWLPDPSEPLPVGDGTWPMLIFALLYAGVQYIKTKKKSDSTTSF